MNTEHTDSTGQPNAGFFAAATNPTRALLSAADILTFKKPTFEDVHVPEWGGTVRVYAPTSVERDAFEDSIVTTKKSLKNGRVKVERETVMRGARGKVLALACRDEHGERLFTDAQAEALNELAAKPVNRVFEVWMRLAGMTEDEIENLGNASTPAQSDGSTSASL
jgi:hypothetical protein